MKKKKKKLNYKRSSLPKKTGGRFMNSYYYQLLKDKGEENIKSILNSHNAAHIAAHSLYIK